MNREEYERRKKEEEERALNIFQDPEFQAQIDKVLDGLNIRGHYYNNDGQIRFTVHLGPFSEDEIKTDHRNEFSSHRFPINTF